MKALFSLLLGFFIMSPCCAQVYEHTLKNGLHIFVEPDHRSPATVVQVWYRVGSADEPNGITGISHMLEHMMFRGTPRYPGKTFSKIIALNGGRQNAATNHDYTFYYENISKTALPQVLLLEADRMQHLTLDQAAFEKEKNVVREERRWRIEDQPYSDLYERFQAAAYLSNPYHHPVIGWPSDIEHYTRSDLVRWYNQWYAPNNATLVVVGDVSPKQVFSLAQSTFGVIDQRPLPHRKPHPDMPAVGYKAITLNRPSNVPLLFMGFQVPSINHSPKDWTPYALTLLASVLGGTNSSRLDQYLVRKNGLATSVSTHYDPLQRFNTQFIIVAMPTPTTSIKQLQTAIDQQIKQLQTSPINAKTLERLKTQARAHFVYSIRDSLSARARMLGKLSMLQQPASLMQNYLTHLDAVTAKQIQAVAKQYLHTNSETVAQLTPTSQSRSDT